MASAFWRGSTAADAPRAHVSRPAALRDTAVSSKQDEEAPRPALRQPHQALASISTSGESRLEIAVHTYGTQGTVRYPYLGICGCTSSSLCPVDDVAFQSAV